MHEMSRKDRAPFPLKIVLALTAVFAIFVAVFPAVPLAAADPEQTLCGEVLGPDADEHVIVCGSDEWIDFKDQPISPFPTGYFKFEGAVIESGTPNRVLASWTSAHAISGCNACYEIFLPMGASNSYGYEFGSRIALPTELEGEAPGQEPSWYARLFSVSAAMLSSFLLIAVFTFKKKQ